VWGIGEYAILALGEMDASESNRQVGFPGKCFKILDKILQYWRVLAKKMRSVKRQ